jgi:hypothetical protein
LRIAAEEPSFAESRITDRFIGDDHQTAQYVENPH